MLQGPHWKKFLTVLYCIVDDFCIHGHDEPEYDAYFNDFVTYMKPSQVMHSPLWNKDM